ncbi:MAG: glycoside hydrolase family 127 protein [bacterium]|nr:glycoside hydrolase family 127 protein [bacterium]
MNDKLSRREMLGAMAAASAALGAGVFDSPAAAQESPRRNVLTPFDYRGVRLLPGRWQKQYVSARDFYYGLSNDDILKGFRDAAGLPAPGKTLGGWCQKNSYVIFGQWLQAMARAAHANNDAELRDKAAFLMTEWAKTVNSAKNMKDGKDILGNHYRFEKLVGGLLDMHLYAGHPDALPLLETITDWGIANLNRDIKPAQTPPLTMIAGTPGEWYTVAENLYRAHEATGKAKYNEFAEAWHYTPYWDKFADSAHPDGVHGFHAYSHLNTFSSAAMAYAVGGDSKYLKIIRNAHDFFQNVQCFATGGFGPSERLVPDDGTLGDSLETRIDHFETPCGSWAGFKLCRYLMQFTGEARYGDWMERLLYNGIGAALPITTEGRNFYFSNYGLGGGIKVYDPRYFSCCSGTYFQCVTEYQNLIYFKDAAGLYVNLYLPSEAAWKVGDSDVKLTLTTEYPETETISLGLQTSRPARFPLRLRVPAWARDFTVQVNGAGYDAAAKPGAWATVDRAWQNGDRVEIRIPLRLRRQAVDTRHPERVAVVRGPVVLAWEYGYFALPVVPREEDLEGWLAPTDQPAVFRIGRPGPEYLVRDCFRPFYQFAEGRHYRMYFDPKLHCESLW